jgi:hypothetical protein
MLARLRHADRIRRYLFIAADRKWLACGENNANGPKPTSRWFAAPDYESGRQEFESLRAHHWPAVFEISHQAGLSVPGPVLPRQIDDFRPVLKMKCIEMIPLTAPYESKPFEDIDNLIGDLVAPIERAVLLPVPEPVVAEFVVKVDRRTVRVH